MVNCWSVKHSHFFFTINRWNFNSKFESCAETLDIDSSLHATPAHLSLKPQTTPLFFSQRSTVVKRERWWILRIYRKSFSRVLDISPYSIFKNVHALGFEPTSYETIIACHILTSQASSATGRLSRYKAHLNSTQSEENRTFGFNRFFPTTASASWEAVLWQAGRFHPTPLFTRFMKR